MSKTAIRLVVEYDGTIIHSRQVTVEKTLATRITDIVSKQIDGMAETILTADKL